MVIKATLLGGNARKKKSDDLVPCILEPDGNVKVFRKNWARLILKIYDVDPLICPKCKGNMRIISFEGTAINQ